MIKIICIIIFCFPCLTMSKHWEVYNTENSEIPINNLSNITIDSNDNLWFYTNNSVYKYNQNNNRWKEFNEENSNLTSDFSHIEIGLDGTVYVSSSNIYKFNPKTNDFELFEENINCSNFTYDENGTLYFVRSVLVYQKDGDNVKSIYDGSVKGPNYPSNLVIDEDNTLWFGTDGFNSSFYKYTHHELTSYDSLFNENGRLKSTLISLDKNNNIWHNNGDDAIVFNFNKSKNTWEIYNSNNSPLGIDRTFSKSFSVDNKSNLWVLSALNVTKPPINLHKFDGAIWKSYNIDSVVNLEEDFLLVLDVDVDSKGNVWIASNHGLIKFNENTTSVQSTISDKIKLFPNPAQNRLHIDTGNKIVKSISISDILGNELMDIDYNYNNPNTLDISTLTTGTYFINVMFDDGSSTIEKFVKE